MDLVTTKILVALLLGIFRFLFGLLPIKVYYYLLIWGEKGDTEIVHLERHKFLSCLVSRCQSFGGGVLFATCFLHMIPEVRKSVDDLMKFWKLRKENEFPFSELVICLGFFMVYFIEEFTHWFVHKERCNRTAPSCQVDEPVPVKYTDLEPFKENHTNGVTTKPSPVKCIEVDKRKVESAHSKRTAFSTDSFSLQSTDSSDDVIIKSSRSFRPNSTKLADDFVKMNAEAEVKHIEKEQQKSIRGLLVVIALSFHSIFEGLAIGLQKSTGNIWYMFTAIMVHAATILFCIGFEMAVEGIRTTTILFHMVVLALVSPLGVVIGLLITLKSNMDTGTKSAAIVVLEGISAGTVLYITFFEVLNREKNRRQFRISRSVCMVSGFGMMIALQTLEI